MSDFDPNAIAKALEDLRNAGVESSEILKELNKALDGMTASQLEALKSTSGLTDAEKRAIDAKKGSLELIRESAKAQYEEAKAKYEAAKALKDKAKQIKAEKEALESLIKAKKAELEAELDPDERKKINEAIEETSEKLDKLQVSSKEAGESLNAFAKAGSEFAESLFAGEKAGDKMIGSVKSLTSSFEGLLKKKMTSKINSMGAGMKGFAAGAGGVILILIELGKAIAQLSLDLFNASAEFQKITGLSAQFSDSIIENYDDVREFGVTLKGVSESGQALTRTFTDFTRTDQQTRNSLVQTSAVLAKLGVSNEDFAKNVQLSTKALGMTGLQAEKTQRDLVSFATEIGVAPSQMAADFNQAGASLAKLGKDGTDAFKDLARQAKLTGIEVTRLLQITDKFDTFEGAAEQAGRLNAALGGNFVNAMELLTETDPSKRFLMLTDAIKDTGKSFDDMSYFEAKFFAESLGLNDVSELALALSDNTDMLNKHTKKQSAEYIELAERAAEVQSFQEQLNALFADMVPILMPIVTGLRDLIEVMRDNREATQGTAVAFGILGIALTLLTAPVTATSLAIAGLIAAISGLLYFGFKKRSSPTFYEYIILLGEKMAILASSFLEAVNPVNLVKNAMKSLKGVLDFNIADTVSGFDLNFMDAISEKFSAFKEILGSIKSPLEYISDKFSFLKDTKISISAEYESLKNISTILSHLEKILMYGPMAPFIMAKEGIQELFFGGSIEGSQAQEQALLGIENTISSMLGFGRATENVLIPSNEKLNASVVKTSDSFRNVDAKLIETTTTAKAAAPVLATANSVSSAIDNSSRNTNTTNNYTSGREEQPDTRPIIIEMDGVAVGRGTFGKFAKRVAMK